MNVCAYVTAYIHICGTKEEAPLVMAVVKTQGEILVLANQIFCCCEKRNLITARLSVCSLGWGERNRVTG